MRNNTKAILHEALERKKVGLFKDIPHTDLHCHSILSAPFDILRKIAPEIERPPVHFESFIDFNRYLQNNIAVSINSVHEVRALIQGAFERLAAEGVCYTEISFDLTMPEHLGIDLDEYLEMIKQEREKISQKLKVCVEAGLDREIEPERLIVLLKKSLKHELFGSIDLYGDEFGRPIGDFADIYQLARDHGLKRKAHVGEFGTADDIVKAIEKLDLHAVQHGINAAQSQEVMKTISEKGIPLNICPQSNIALGVVQSIKNHPIRQLLDAGVTVTINSDDFLIFGRSTSGQLIDLYENGICSEDEIVRLIDNGLSQVSNIYI